MQVTETSAEGLKRSYRATATAAEIDGKVDEKLEEIRPTAQLPGFRKGKAPLAILRQRFGQSVLGEVLDEMVKGALSSHLQEHGHRPAEQPEVKMVNETAFAPGDDLTVEFSYEMLPDVPEVAFNKIELERLVVEPADAAVQEALTAIAENAKTFEAKEAEGATADDGDQVVIDFTGRIDGEAFDGGAAEDFPLVIGSNQFIPGFEPQLVGAAAGETRDVTVTFPDEYGAAQLAGKEAVFEVAIKEVRGPKAAEIDDELAKRYGAESLDGLKDQVRERLSDEYKTASRSILKRGLLDALDADLTMELPRSLVAREADSIAHQIWHDENPDVEGHDHPEIEPTDEHTAIAERRVKLMLLFGHIGSENSIEVTENEINNGLLQQARRYPGQEREFFEYARNNPQMRQAISTPIFEDKVVDYILELAQVSDKSVDADGLKTALEALDD